MLWTLDIKNMNRLLLIVISLLIISCGSEVKNSYTESDIGFQNHLGEQKTTALNRGIKEFEDWLGTSIGHKNIEDNYREYLQYIFDHRYDSIPWNVNNSCSPDTRVLFMTSGLLDDIYDTIEYIVHIDTINHQFTRVVNSNDSLELIPIGGQLYSPGINIDSLYQDLRYSICFNRKGKYYSGLKKYANDPVIKNYIEDKGMGCGGVSVTIFAGILLQEEVDYDDYLIKVILFYQLCLF